MDKVDVAKFDALIKEDKPVVCDFFATWCGPCRMLAPVMEKCAEKFSDRAVFIKVDVDECYELAARYGVMSIPMVGVFKGGKLVEKSVGFTSQSETEEFLDANI